MMDWGYSGMMGNYSEWSVLGSLTEVLIIIVLGLLAVYLWKQIRKR